MESYLWERERRDELEKEVPDGTIFIEVVGSQVATSKQGYIAFTIAMEHEMYKQMRIPIGIDTTLKSLKEILSKHWKTRELKRANKPKGSNITKKRNRKK